MFVAMGTPAGELDDPVWSAAALEWFAVHLDDPQVAIVLAEVEGAVVASAVGEVTRLIPGPSCPNGSCGLLNTVSTLPEHRGRGHAAAVTDAVIGWFEDGTDVTRIDLFATPEGARIYSRRGFTEGDFPAMRRRVLRG
jgi:GNAT superfamily N-acetyltransferase